MRQAVQELSPIIVHIETRDSQGTGFLASTNREWTRIGIATAYHVIEKANRNGGSITIRSHSGGEVVIDTQDDGVEIRHDYDSDSALIVIDFTEELTLPKEVAPLFPSEEDLLQAVLPGHPVGWIGYPGLLQRTQCFFSGNISAYYEPRKLHYIDGVAINGVSGGPVFGRFPPSDRLMVVGVLSAYQPNISGGQALPGLSVAMSAVRLLRFFGY